MAEVMTQAGVLAIWEQRICLITSHRQRRWIIPKGMIEAGQTPIEAATQEAWEEAGVRGLIWERSLGGYGYRKGGRDYWVRIFYMQVEEVFPQWPEMYRARIWVSRTEALARVEEPGLRSFFQELTGRVSVE